MEIMKNLSEIIDLLEREEKKKTHEDISLFELLEDTTHPCTKELFELAHTR